MSKQSPIREFLSRFDRPPGRHRPRRIRNGALTVTIVGGAIALALTVGYTRDVPFVSGGDTFKAEFAQTPNLRAGYPVRVRGVKVGKVTSVQRDAARRVALVTMEIDGDRHIVLKRDARAAVLWRTLLGRNMFVDLDPGSPSAAPLDGDTIRVSHTQPQVEFDQLFEPLDQSGRKAAQTAVREFDTAFRDPKTPGRNLDRLAPAMRAIAPALDAVRGERPGDLSRLIDNTRRTMSGLTRSEARLIGLIDGADVTFGVTAARRADLGASVRQTPQTLSDTRQTMARLRTTLDLLDPVADRLRPGVRRLRDASRSARTALAQAAPLLRDARPLSERLQRALAALRPASQDATKLIAGLDPTLTRTSKTLIPWLRGRNSIGVKNYQTIGSAFSAVSSSGGMFNSAGHQLRFQGATVGTRSLGIPCATQLTDPSATQLLNCQALSLIFTGGAR